MGMISDIIHEQYEEEIKALKAKVSELDLENKRLLDLFRAHEIDSNEPNDRSQEAAHYNWIDEQNKKLQSELLRKAKELESAREVIKSFLIHSRENADDFDFQYESVCERAREWMKQNES